MHGRPTLHGTAARAIIVIASLWTAGLQLLAPGSLAYRAAGDGWLIDAINLAVLCIAGLAAADVLWHDILRRGLILPGFPAQTRHQVCVWVYSALAAAFAIRAFIATGDTGTALQVGGYYVLIAAGILLEALALANEQREEQPSCRSESDSA
jgi:hypothetical protein